MTDFTALSSATLSSTFTDTAPSDTTARFRRARSARCTRRNTCTRAETRDRQNKTSHYHPRAETRVAAATDRAILGDFTGFGNVDAAELRGGSDTLLDGGVDELATVRVGGSVQYEVLQTAADSRPLTYHTQRHRHTTS
jgi:hypothetical protein